MSDCSKHKKDVAGISDMKVLAEMIGDLNYETLAEFFLQLAIKIDKDSVKDFNGGRIKLSQSLKNAVNRLELVQYSISEAWEISEPFMTKNKTPQHPVREKDGVVNHLNPYMKQQNL